MCVGGGGSSGPSSAQLAEQAKQAAAQAQAEADKITAQKDLEKQAQNDKIVSDQASIANSDAQRRVKNRTLLAGLGQDESNPFGLEDPTSASSKKAKRSTLLGSF